ncbi:MAG TPA: hypothetical protein VIK18_01235 [Pirellulales bacterium]
MRVGRWALCLWPGLAQLWQGSLGGLLAAIGFGLLVDLVVLGGLAWNEWAPHGQMLLLALVATGIGLASAVYSMRQVIVNKELTAEFERDLFPLARGEYLRGNWFEVERLCQQLLRLNPADIEARLLLATTCRRATRRHEARRELEELSLLAGSEKWQQEIECEHDLLSEAVRETAEQSAEAPALRAAA